MPTTWASSSQVTKHHQEMLLLRSQGPPRGKPTGPDAERAKPLPSWTRIGAKEGGSPRVRQSAKKRPSLSCDKENTAGVLRSNTTPEIHVFLFFSSVQ